MKLFIDNREADTDPLTVVSISLSIVSATRLELGRTGYSKTIRLPMTLHNMALMGDAEQVHAAEPFNQQSHTARIEAGGSVVIEGELMLSRCETRGEGTGWYAVNIIGAGKEWVKLAAETMFRDTAIDFSTRIDASSVLQSWDWEAPVRFLPVQRDTLSVESTSVIAPVRMLTFSDYHPFIQAKAFLDAVTRQAGYRICSEFLESDYFRSFYLSGNYPEKDVALLKERMGFLAKRFEQVTAVADRFGRVYADPFTTLNTVGNLVDTADPDESFNGLTLTGVYNRNNVLRTVGKRIAFYPVESVDVGFEYRLRYTSQFRIKDRTELTCFNTVYLDDDWEREFKVMNRYTDCRPYFQDGMDYRLIVFGHAAGNTYRFTYDLITNPNANLANLRPEDYTTVTLKTFDMRTVLVGTQLNRQITNPQLWIRRSDGQYDIYPEDWALYEGYVGETGNIVIDLTVRSAAKPAKPSEPRYFHLIHFGGAEPGMSLTLSNRVELKPFFLPHPAEGDTVDFAGIAAHEVRQIEMINGIKQMFNLYFYTDTDAKTIYIEPRDSFYRNDIVVDWSERIDPEKPVTTEELGADLSQQITFRYQPGDGASSRWNESNRQVLGRWSAPIRNRFAKEGEKIYWNPLFTTTINLEGVYPEASSASFMQAGGRDRSEQTSDVENLNFPPKIVRYLGMNPLPESQWWGWPSYGRAYPLAAFQRGGTDGFTLCFGSTIFAAHSSLRGAIALLIVL